jgi:hypothetical protein
LRFPIGVRTASTITGCPMRRTSSLLSVVAAAVRPVAWIGHLARAAVHPIYRTCSKP